MRLPIVVLVLLQLKFIGTEAANCDKLQAPEHGSVHLTRDNRAGSLAIFSCDDGKFLVGPSISKCLKQGRWAVPPPTCEDYCIIPDIKDGKIGQYEWKTVGKRTHKLFMEFQVGEKINPGENMTFLCDDGLVPEENSYLPEEITPEQEILCNDGKWSTSLKCEPVSCVGQPPSIKHGRPVVTKRTHKHVIDYQCDDHFDKTPGQVECFHGTWRGDPPVCTDSRCYIDQLDYEGLEKPDEKFLFNDENFKMSCRSGYEITGWKRKISCKNGRWDITSNPCTKGRCYTYQLDYEGLVKPDEEFLFNDEDFEISCSDGFKISGLKRKISCNKGRWDITGNPCIKEPSCDKPQAPEHGLVQVADEIREGSLALFFCDAGKLLLGSSISRCLEGRQWSYPSPTCVDYCVIPDIENGNIGQYEWKIVRGEMRKKFIQFRVGEKINPDEKMTFLCDEGFVPEENFHGNEDPNSDQETVCNDGKWSASLQCESVSCLEEPPSIKHGQPVVTSRMHKHVIDYQCDEHFDKTPGHVECFLGTWRGDLPVCTDSRCYTDQLHYRGLIKPDAELFLSDENFDISCRDGYKITEGKQKISCKKARWDITGNPCTKEPCPPLDENGKFIIHYSDDRKENSSAYYICKDSKLKINGSDTRICEENGQWSGADPECIDITCPKFQTTGSLTVKYTTGNKANSVAIFHCKYPATMVGGATAKCQMNGTWSTTQTYCLVPEIRCYPLDKKGTFDIDYSDDRKVNSTASYTCKDSKLKIYGSDTRNCEASGEWSGVEPECVGNICPEFRTRGSLTVTYTDGNKVNSAAIFQCKEPDTIDGTPIAKCQMDGTWSVPRPTCLKPQIYCPVIDEKGIFIIEYSDDRKVNSTATYTCNSTKLKISGYDTRFCEESGQWSDAEPECIDITCTEFQTKGSLIVKYPKGKIVDSTAIFHCKYPAIIVGRTISICQVDGTWNNPRPYCIEPEIPCPPLDEKGIFTIHYSKDRETNSSAYYICKDTKLKISGPDTRKCEPGGYWSDANPECVDITCPEFEITGNLTVNYSNGNKVDSVAKFHCNTSAIAIDRTISICRMDGTWSIPAPHCSEPEISCPHLDEKEIFTIHYSNERKENSTAYYTCKDNKFKISGSDTRKCEASGQWSDAEPECIDITCPEFQTTGSLTVNYSDEKKVDSTAIFHCNEPATLVGRPVAICQMDGTWSIDSPHCSDPDIRCPELDEKGIFEIDYSDDRKVYSTASYTCIDIKFKVFGSDIRNCEEGGQWSGADPVCAGTTCPEFEPTGSLTVRYTNGNKVDSAAIFHCNYPATLVGRPVAICQMDGTWSIAQPDCSDPEISCPRLDEKGIFTIYYTADRNINSIAYYTCKDNKLKISGSDTRKCEASGQWSGTEPECLELFAVFGCPVKDLILSLPNNVEPEVEDETEESLPPESEIQLRCSGRNKKRMILLGSKMAKCTQRSTWEFEMTQCIVGCHLRIASLSSLIIHPVKDHYRYGESVQLSCPAGQELTTNAQKVKCIGGRWSESLPDCEDVGAMYYNADF